MWPSVFGGIAGVVTSVLVVFFAPWVRLRVEQHRQRHQEHRERISEWRAGLSAAESEGRTAERQFLSDPRGSCPCDAI